MAKILLIDDSRFACNLLRRILRREGYEVCEDAHSGREGIEKYRKFKPDLVFCDVMMNDMNGLDCLRQIKKENPDAKVVVCSSVGDDMHAGDAFEAGATDFLPKPLKDKDIIRVARALVGEAGSGERVSYMKLMEERAAARGLNGKPVLDFFEAFQKVTGMRMDDPKVDREYLKKNAESIVIGVHAMLSRKLTLQQVNGLKDILRELAL